MFDNVSVSSADYTSHGAPAAGVAPKRLAAAFLTAQNPLFDAAARLSDKPSPGAGSGAVARPAWPQQQRLLNAFDALRPALPDRSAARAALLDQPLPNAGRDFRREPLSVHEFNTLRAQRAAGRPLPDYPPVNADLGAADYSDPGARAAAMDGLRQLGWHQLGEDELDWQRIQVSVNSRRRLAEDHLGRTVLQVHNDRGWQNAGDLRTYDGLGGIFKPGLRADSGGQVAVFGPFANAAQIQEILANDWLPSFFDGSEFHAHERPRYRDDGTLIDGGEHGEYRPRRHAPTAIPIRG